MTPDPEEPTLLEGGLHVDTRGTLGYVNDFTFGGVNRMYWVRANQQGMFRGWVGHRREQKWFLAVQGSVLLSVVKPDDWAAPSKDLHVRQFLLSGSKPQVVHVPAGHCTGTVDMDGNSLLLVFSSGTIKDAKDDDFRFPSDYWNLPQQQTASGTHAA